MNKTDLKNINVASVASEMLAYWDAVDHHRRQLEQPIIDQGCRIVTGGQTNGEQWEITDVDTGEVLATGTNGIDEFDQTMTDNRWAHRDYYAGEALDAFDEPTNDHGLTAERAEEIREWVDRDPDEARLLLS